MGIKKRASLYEQIIELSAKTIANLDEIIRLKEQEKAYKMNLNY